MTAKRVSQNICRKTQGIAEEGNTCLQTPGTCESCPDWGKRSKRVSFTVPLIPPSVNHYKMRTRRGVTFVSDVANKFKADFAIFARGKSLCLGMTCKELKKLTYTLEATVYFGKKQRGDGDNLWKCLADALKSCAVIHSDAAVKDWIMHVRRDNANPRTEITIEVHQ